jgi:hypothetical protein
MAESSETPRTVSRGIFLTIMAVLLAVLAISNTTKSLQHQNDPSHLGLVIFGYRLQTMAANAILGPAFGIVLLVYAWGIWKMRRWVLPLAIVYAFYVPTNLVLFWFVHGGEAHPSMRFIIQYLAVALTGSIGTALYLSYHRERLA